VGIGFELPPRGRSEHRHVRSNLLVHAHGSKAAILAVKGRRSISSPYTVLSCDAVAVQLFDVQCRCLVPTHLHTQKDGPAGFSVACTGVIDNRLHVYIYAWHKYGCSDEYR
jgi:hypothetical protein